ncbi:hypothetical protein UU9_13388 [Rhodanobacter fulvus Jip2]|uniref:Haem-binding uptake Tiki superfamily ChaN domain-containing protein n=2 Tax=Rhodanobacter TaxID=75309 RepID=I4VLM1_9GAMM|nr:hypothetical protein UU9_13388 [Rhodanobacter fulvus Jip2]
MNCSEPDGLPRGKLLLFGEMHGSKETPALIAQLACFLSKHQEVAIGLEIPSRDQPLIDAYLASRGTNASREKLMSSVFWKTDRDGRSSAAMFELIDAIRDLKEHGRAIDLFAFDDQPGTTLERNVAIANGIRRFVKEHREAKVVALMGNIHAMQDPMNIGKEKLVPSGYLLKDLTPISILVTYPKGTIWACMPDCRKHDLSPRTPVAGPAGFKNGATLDGYSRMFLLNSITASPPAIMNGSKG